MTARRQPRSAALAGLVVLASLVASVGLAVAPATAGPGPDQPRTSTERFYASEPYTGMFADPSVMRVGNRFVAAATTHDGLNMPLMSSSDLRTWTPRAPLPDHARWSDWRGYNDALPDRPSWAVQAGERANQFSLWAPALARVAGRFVAAYSAAVRAETPRAPRQSCIGLAVSDTAEGPYVPTSSSPTVCFSASPRGAIDPEIHVGPAGVAYLLWKQEGIPNRQEPALMSQPLRADGTGLAPGTTPTRLMSLVRGTWKGGVIENPSMIRKEGRTYLFYSAHDWFSEDYATGYAICRTPVGPCVDQTHRRPLMRSGARSKGPGGADAFLDRVGRLRLAYAAWDPGRVGPTGTNARMLHVARLGVGPRGLLRVIERG